MLRARFSVDDAGVIVSQRYLSAADGGPSWGYYDWRFVAKAAPSCCVNGNRGLIRRQGRYAASFTSLTAAPRLRADVLRVSSSDRRCGFWRVIVSDLQRLHQGNRCRQRHQLPPMGRTVKAIRGNPARPMRLLAGDDRRAARLRHAQRRDAGPEFCRFECDVALTALLMDGCHRAYNTSVREVLLAARRRCCRHGTAVRTVTSRWNTMAAISMTIRSGEGTVGWFTALMPLRITAHECQNHAARHQGQAEKDA